MKTMKKIINVLLIAVMIFTELSPYAVVAAQPTTATKGQIYNPQTDSVGISATVETKSYTSGEYSEGDVEIQKIVSKTDVEGKYKVEFKVRGKKVTETTVTTKPVYAVVVLDRSNSMDDEDNKWEDAVQGSKDFATKLLENVSNAQIALVGFSGSRNDECTNYEFVEDEDNNEGPQFGQGPQFGGQGGQNGEWVCTSYSYYNDATLLRGFANSNLNSVNFGEPNGGTNIEAGLRLAKQQLDAITVDALKYVIVIGDGAPTYYYNENGATTGDGSSYDEDADSAANSIATQIKNAGTKIYAIGYEVAANSDAENTLKLLATPNETVNGVTKTYYFNADANAVGSALTNIAGSITTEAPAGTNATVNDKLGSAFSLTSGSTTLKVDTITEDWTSMGSFYITIDGDSATGWYPTNDGYTLTYTDANNQTQTITSNVNPEVYWEQNKYNYRIEYYYDNVIDSNKTVNGQAVKDTEISVTQDMINANLKTGYEYKSITTNPITIKNSGENVIKVYYERITYNYIVEHYLENENGEYTLKETDSDNKIKYQEEATYTPNSYTGYAYVSSKTEYNQDDLLIEDNDLVIKLYYDKNTYSYVVRHNLENKDGNGYTLTDSETLNAKYQEEATYEENSYDGYVFNDSLTKNNQSDYIIEDNNMMIDLYYELIDYTYEVQYYTKDVNSNTYTEVDTYTSSAYYNEEVSAQDKSFEGFTYEKTEYTKNGEVVSSNKVTDNNLVIKVYYVRNNYEYKVEHYTENLDGTFKLEDTDSYTNVEYNSNVIYETNVYIGFTYDKTLDVNTEIKKVPANNELVLKLYYVRNNYEYKVEHYTEKLDGTFELKDTDSYTNVEYESDVVYETNVYTGFTYDSSLDVNTEVKLVPANNELVLKLYYVRNNYEYKVEHYTENLDGTFELKDTDSYTNVEYNSNVIYELNSYEGFTYDKTKDVNTDIKLVPANNELVLKLYYVRNNYEYKVEHYLQDLGKDTFTKQENDTVVYTNKEYGSDVVYTTNTYIGFTYDESLDVNTEVKLVPANNNLVIKLYYVRNNYSYKVEHYLENLDGETYTQTSDIDVYTNIEFGSTATYETNNYEGFEFNESLTTPERRVVPANDNLVIKLYYDRAICEYKVNYYYDNVKDDSKTYTETEVFGKEVSTYTDKLIDGYHFVKDTAPITITTNKDENIIDVYYEKNIYTYTVEYYTEDLGSDTFTMQDTYTRNEYHGETVTPDSKTYTGFTYLKEEYLNNGQLTNSKVIVDNNLVIKVYFVRNNYNYKVEHYTQDLGKDTFTKQDTDTYNNKEYGSNVVYETNVYTGFTYDSSLDVNTEIKVVPANNELVIELYYVRNNYEYKVEHYTENLDGSFKLEDTDSYTNVEYNSDVIYETNVYTGFTYDSSLDVNTDVKLVPANNELVIELYYVRNNYEYKVEHYTENLDGSFKLEDTDSYTNVEYNSDVIYETNVYTGFTYDSSLDVNTEVKLVPANNELVLKLYYVRNNYEYKVEHYTENLDGSFKLEDTDSYTNVEYNSDVIYETNVYTGFTYDSSLDVNTDVKLVPANNELVIELYYVRNTYKYVVEHYLENDNDSNFTLQENDTEAFEARYNELGVYTSNEYENYTFDDSLTEPEDLTVNDDTLTIKLYYLKNKTNVKVHYVIRDVDTLEYIPFNVYGGEGDEFAGLDLEDLLLTGKVDTSFIINGRNPKEYEFVGLYEGNLLDGIDEVSITTNSDQSYEGTYESEDLEFTYVYQAPAGDIPPITGIENSVPNYISYILIGVITLLVGGCYKFIKREEENELN